MAFTAKTRKNLVHEVIKELNDFGTEDWLSGSLNNSATTFVCTDANFKQYKLGTTIEMDQELLRVTANATSTTISVKRGVRGTTAASHSSGEIIRINPKYTQERIIGLINTCLETELQKQVLNDTSITTTGNTYLYNLPAAVTKENLRAVYFRSSNTDATAKTDQRTSAYRVNKGQGTSGVDQLEFRFLQTAGLYVTLAYRSGFTYLETDAASCDLPLNAAAQSLPVYYACAYLLPSLETKRERRDRNSYPEGSPPMTARERSGDWYMKEFRRIRHRQGLAPNDTRSRLVGW